MQSVTNILHAQPGHLRSMMQHSRNLQALTQKLQSLLPPHLAPHCIVAAWDNEKVILHSTNGAAGTVLRYQLPKILLLLQQDESYKNVKQIICHIRPPQQTKDHAQSLERPERSLYAATLLESTAENMSAPEVQQALRRLAKHVSPKITTKKPNS